MSWKPPRDLPHEALDPRLDPYRDRAAIVLDGDDVVLKIYARSDLMWRQTGGHLWWRRWSHGEEFLHLLGEDSRRDGPIPDLDSWVYGDNLTRELEDWSKGRFRDHGTTLMLVWLTDEESVEVRRYWEG